jgi:type VI secretion system secreted protein Hcp
MSREEANRIARAAERIRRSRRLGLKVAIPTAAAFGVGAAFAVGAIPGSDGTITGCYVTNTDIVPGANHPGELRVIDPSLAARLPSGGLNEEAACLNGEATITWSQRGPQGPVGLQGPAGPQGPAGAQGPGGAQGSPLIGSTSFGFSGGGRTFLKIEGIRGESTDKQHKGEIEISSFSFGATNASSGGGGAGAGKVISSFTITKKLDKASPLLFKAAATGEHFQKVVISFARKTRGKQLDYLEYKLSQVLISSIQDGTSQGGGAPVEQVSFNFAKVEQSFLGPNGRPIQSVVINIGANKGA